MLVVDLVIADLRWQGVGHDLGGLGLRLSQL